MPKNFKIVGTDRGCGDKEECRRTSNRGRGYPRDGQKTLRRGPEVVEELQNRGLPARMRVFQRLQSRWKNMPHNKPKREGGRWWSRVALLVVFSNF